MVPGTEPPNKKKLLHLIDPNRESHLRDRDVSWVWCDCGDKVEGQNAKECGQLFAAHRREMGVVST